MTAALPEKRTNVVTDQNTISNLDCQYYQFCMNKEKRKQEVTMTIIKFKNLANFFITFKI